MASVSALPSPKPRGVTTNANVTTADDVRASAGTGCMHLTFKDKTQRDAYSAGLEVNGTRHDKSGDNTIRIFYANNR